MTALDAAKQLADWWPPVATIAPETGRSTCIETARHVVEAFRRSGVKDARPWPCELHAYNAAATARVLAGGTSLLRGAQVVQVSPEAAAKAGLKAGGWHAHLVVDHPEFLLDLTLPGLLKSVGGRGFEHMTSVCASKAGELAEIDGGWSAMSEDGVCVRWVGRPELSSWRNTAAWRGGLDEQVIGTLTEFVRERL